MLIINNLVTSKDLDVSEMAEVVGGWWIFGSWGGTIGNLAPTYREPTRTTYYSDGRRARDYRDNGPVWPTVE